MRDFVEERRWQRVREVSDKFMPPMFKELYMQNPLMRFLMTAPPKQIVEYRRRFLAEQEAAGNILPPENHADRS